MSVFWILTLGVWGSSIASVQMAYTHDTYTRLADHLLTGYDVRAQPVANTYVNIELKLTHMNGLDTINQVLDVAGATVMSWEDSRLQWNLTEYNMSQILLPISEVWVPELSLYNSVENRQIFSDSEDTASERVAIYHTGDLLWFHSIHFRSHCTVEIMFYPFDGQTCTIKVVPSTSYDEDLVISPGDETVNTEIYAENGEWIISDTAAIPSPIQVTGAKFHSVDFKLCLQRRESYYIMNILLPVVFLAFLGPTVFVLPVESGEKAGFALTILLSLSVVMTIVSDRIPSTSTQVSLLSVYILATFIICMIEVVITTVTMRIQQSYTAGQTPSPRFRKFIKNHLAPLVCYKKPKKKENYAAWKKRKDNQESRSTDEQGDAQSAHIKTTVSRLDSMTGADFTMSTCTGNEIHAESADIDCSDDYTYKDFCVMFDTINFYVFHAITIIMTMAFFLTISFGGNRFD